MRRLLVVLQLVVGVYVLGGIAPASAAPPAPAVAFGFERFTGNRALGTGANATANGFETPPATLAGPAAHGKALPFTSTKTQYLEVDRTTRLDVNRFTLTAWVRYVANVHDERWEIMEKAGSYWANIRTDSRRVRAGGFFGGCSPGRDGGKWLFLDSTTQLAAGRWYFVAATYNGSTLSIFVDGKASGSLPVAGTTCVNANPLEIGAKKHPVTGIEALLDGTLDDVRVYNSALTPTQLQTVMKWAVP